MSKLETVSELEIKSALIKKLISLLEDQTTKDKFSQMDSELESCTKTRSLYSKINEIELFLYEKEVENEKDCPRYLTQSCKCDENNNLSHQNDILHKMYYAFNSKYQMLREKLIQSNM